MSKEKTVEKQNKNFLSGLFRQQIFIPIAALIILAVFNLIADPSFFKITLGYNSAGDPVLSGYLMTILDYGSELAILAIGMTLVTAASGGQDISVGAAIAIAGSVMLRVLCGTNSRPGSVFQDPAHGSDADPLYGRPFHRCMDQQQRTSYCK